MRLWRFGTTRPARRDSVALGERLSPTQQHAVDRGRPDERLGWERQARGMQDERPRLKAAQPTVERDQLLEGTGVVELGVVEAADHDVGDMGKAIRAE